MNETRKVSNRIDGLKKQIELLKKYCLPMEELGLYASIVSNNFMTVEVETLAEVKKITSMMPPSGEVALVKFASADSIVTASPYKFNVNNYSHSETDEVTVRYKSDIDVWIKIPFSAFHPELIRQTEVTRQVRRGSNTHTEVVGYNASMVIGKTQSYAGVDGGFGTRLSYALDENDAQIFSNLLEDQNAK